MAFKNCKVLVGDVAVQLRDGMGSTTSAGNPFIASAQYVTGGQRWPAIGAVFVNLGAGPSIAYIATMDTPGLVRTHANFGDRVIVRSMTEVDGGIAVEYLDRRPDQAMVEAPTVLYRVFMNGGTDQLSSPVPLSSTASTTPGRSYRMTDGAHTRSGANTGTSITGDVSRGDYVNVVCQTVGENVGAPPQSDGGSSVWDRLSNGSYVADFYVDTPKQLSPGEGLQLPIPSDQFTRC